MHIHSPQELHPREKDFCSTVIVADSLVGYTKDLLQHNKLHFCPKKKKRNPSSARGNYRMGSSPPNIVYILSNNNGQQRHLGSTSTIISRIVCFLNEWHVFTRCHQWGKRKRDERTRDKGNPTPSNFASFVLLFIFFVFSRHWFFSHKKRYIFSRSCYHVTNSNEFQQTKHRVSPRWDSFHYIALRENIHVNIHHCHHVINDGV